MWKSRAKRMFFISNKQTSEYVIWGNIMENKLDISWQKIKYISKRHDFLIILQLRYSPPCLIKQSPVTKLILRKSAVLSLHLSAVVKMVHCFNVERWCKRQINMSLLKTIQCVKGYNTWPSCCILTHMLKNNAFPNTFLRCILLTLIYFLTQIASINGWRLNTSLHQ